MTPITWYLYGRSGGAKKAAEEIGVKGSMSGDIASFTDGADDVAVKSLVASITPVQSGTGDPSPTNIRPISGRTGLTVTHSGKNLLEMFGKSGISILSKNIFVKAGTYTASASGISGNYATYVKKATTEGSFSGDIIAKKVNLGSLTFTLKEDTDLMIQWYAPNDSSADLTGKTFQLEIGSTATTYEPYVGQTYPITWETEAGTVYGGTLDVVSGVLTVDKVLIDLGSITNWRYNQSGAGAFDTNGDFNPIAKNNDCICTNYATLVNPSVGAITSGDNLVCINKKDNGTTYTGSYAVGTLVVKDSRYSDVETFKAAMDGVMLCYTLATPQTYQLTPTEVRTLLGGNTIYTDAGEVSVEYVADTKLYIDGKIAELQALILEN